MKTQKTDPSGGSVHEYRQSGLGAILLTSDHAYTVTKASLDRFYSYWTTAGNHLSWDCIFVLPLWIKSWRGVFGRDLDVRVYAIRHHTDIIGIAPLVVNGNTAFIIGDNDVCDYLDFIISPGREPEFFSTLIPFLKDQHIVRLHLAPLHPHSAIYKGIAKNIEQWCSKIQWDQDDVLFELPLPGTWDGFLNMLTGKQRHEIRRKMRKLYASGSIRFRVVEMPEDIAQEMGVFISLFRSNRLDKSEFMTEQMASFFRSLAESFACHGILKLFFLERNDVPIAGVMCFDYHSSVYLYNNGYDHQYQNLSVGLLSKVLSIKYSIESGKKAYNFLKGNEAYKKQLGGIGIPLYRCVVDL